MVEQALIQSTSAALRGVALFSDLPEEELAQLSRLVQNRTLGRGKSLFRRHDPGDGLYIVRRGRLRIWLPHEGATEVTLAEPGPGDFFGELALLDGGSRSANATALEDSDLCFLPRDAFEEFLAAHPKVAARLLAVLSGRLRQTNLQLHAQVSQNANVQFDQDLTWADRLADTLTGFGGSWSFVIAFIAFGFFWSLVNLGLSAAGLWADAYPFNLLNLVVSGFACIQAPFILMSQQRQMRRDRIAADLDYQVSVSNELRLTEINQKLSQVVELVSRQSPSGR